MEHPDEVEPIPAIASVLVAEQEDAAPRMSPGDVATFKRFLAEVDTRHRTPMLDRPMTLQPPETEELQALLDAGPAPESEGL